MGFSPAQVNESSLWEIAAAVDGYLQANSGEAAKPDPLSFDEFDDMLEANKDWIEQHGRRG